ncbi:MAG: glycosyltransferase family 1 protein [Aggregatilineales bacterium]
MHIAINGWFWDQPNTGSGQYVGRLVTHLRRVDPALKITLVLPGSELSLPVPEGVAVVFARGGRGHLQKVLFEQRAFPRLAAAAGADLAHIPYWATPLTSSVPLVTTVLDIIPLILPVYARGVKRRLYTALVSASVKGSAHVIAISEATKGDIARYLKLPADRISITHLAVDESYHPRFGAERDQEVRARYNLPEQFVFYLGGFDVRKQVAQLLHAYSYVHKAHGDEIPLIIAGQEPRWGGPMFPDLRKLALELGLGAAVRWIGPVAEADKPSLYRLASVFAYPSIYEGFGLPVLEALACGTPVVANKIPAIDEIVGDAAYLVDAGDARAMGGALIALLIQNPLRETQIGRGLAQATRYQWQKTARETLAVYARALSQ